MRLSWRSKVPDSARQLDRNEGTADAAARAATRCRGLQLGHVEAEVAEDAAHPPHAGFHALFEHIERGHLASLNLVQRGLQTSNHTLHALHLGELAGSGGRQNRCARFQTRFAIGRRDEDHRVADRGGFRRSLRCVGRRGTAHRGPDRSGDIGQRAECGGARFERRLSPHDLIEFLVELFLVEQLPAGGAIDLGAQFRDSVLIGVLHLRLPRDQPGQDVVAEREIGGRRSRPETEQDDGTDRDPEQHRADPDLSAGMLQGIAALDLRSRMRQYGDRSSRRQRTAVIVWMVLRILGILARTVRHRHSRAGRRQVSVRPKLRGDLSRSWLIFRECRTRDLPGILQVPGGGQHLVGMPIHFDIAP